ncbi:hypothetical protein [Marinitenerispora sediminis]|uniref:hypothetical protein n=1 Tax=Marinitenerispora sediminis TaxID=1931232 RepID=UPI001313E648|nr:hypothetical protein [Marinitenerispora sediminis]
MGQAAPKSNRGCAVGAIVGAVVLVVLLIAGGIGAYVWISGSGGDYQATPDCTVGENSALESLLPGYEQQTNQAIDTGGQEWWDGYQCSWITSSDASGMPATASMIIMRNQNRPGTTGAEETASDLASQSEGFTTTPVQGLGDEAASWYDTEYELGCVGVRTSNIFVSTCYDAATDYSYSSSISESEAVAGAEQLARAAVAGIEATRS